MSTDTVTPATATTPATFDLGQADGRRELMVVLSELFGPTEWLTGSLVVDNGWLGAATVSGTLGESVTVSAQDGTVTLTGAMASLALVHAAALAAVEG